MCRLERRHEALKRRESLRTMAGYRSHGAERARHLTAAVRLWRKRDAVRAKASRRGIDTRDW